MADSEYFLIDFTKKRCIIREEINILIEKGGTGYDPNGYSADHFVDWRNGGLHFLPKQAEKTDRSTEGSHHTESFGGHSQGKRKQHRAKFVKDDGSVLFFRYLKVIPHK